jgi:hypothetical protein
MILEVGLCFFNATKINESYSIFIDATSSQELKFEIEIDTLNWWQTQSPEKFMRLMNPPGVKHAVVIAAKVIHSLAIKHANNEQLVVWGNGPDFDLVILRNLFNKARQPYPFNPKNHRCFRTIKSILGAPSGFDYIVNEKTSHTGRGDAINQAEYLIELNNYYPYGTRPFNIL